MLTVFEKLFLMLKMFLKGGRCITELRDNTPNYAKLKEYGYKIWDTADKYFLTEGTKIIKIFSCAVELFYSEETKCVYIKGYTKRNIEFNEVSRLYIPATNQEDTIDEYQFKLLLSEDEDMEFKMIQSLGIVILSKYNKHVVFNYLLNTIIDEGDTRCIYYENLGVFLIGKDDNYMVWKPEIEPQSRLVSIKVVPNINLQTTIGDKFGYQINGYQIVLFKKNGDIIVEDSYDKISYFSGKIAGKYDQIGKIGDDYFLISVGKKYENLLIPGNYVDRLFTFGPLENIDRYVVIKDEKKNMLTIAYIDPVNNSIKVYKTFKNGVEVNIKCPEMSVEKSGIYIPITVTIRHEKEETL